MGRIILAIIAFNVYAMILTSAFQENTGALFENSIIAEMRLDGLDVNPREWGWGDHYIWRLFASVVVTALVSVLAGAIARNRGSLVAVLANIPSLLLWSGIIYALGFLDFEVEAQTGFIVISIIAIPLTTLIAYFAGGYGEQIQKINYSKDEVLGIKGYHWIWAVFPIYWYSLGIVFVCINFILIQLDMWNDESFLVVLLSLLMLVPIVAWAFPLLNAYLVLSRLLI